jgi:hypothetical protein
MRRMFAILSPAPAQRGYRASGKYGEQTDTRTHRHSAFTLAESVTASARHPEKPLAGATLIAGGITTVSDIALPGRRLL